MPILKGKDYENYQRLNREIRNDCKRAKEEWFNDQCTEIEVLEKQFRKKEMHKKVKQAKTRVVIVLGASKTKMGTAYLTKMR